MSHKICVNGPKRMSCPLCSDTYVMAEILNIKPCLRVNWPCHNFNQQEWQWWRPFRAWAIFKTDESCGKISQSPKASTRRESTHIMFTSVNIWILRVMIFCIINFIICINTSKLANICLFLRSIDKALWCEEMLIWTNNCFCCERLFMRFHAFSAESEYAQ